MALPFGDKLSSSNRLIELNNENKLKTLEPPRTFTGPPEKRPCCVCFDYTGTNLHHKQILETVRESLKHQKENTVVSIQFDARNVRMGTMWMNNRWLIEMGSEAAAGALVYRCININGERIKCHLYDKLIAEEYQRYKKKVGIKDDEENLEDTVDRLLSSNTAQ